MSATCPTCGRPAERFGRVWLCFYSNRVIRHVTWSKP